MRQLILDVRPDTEPRFANFVAGANRQVVDRLQALARPDGLEAIYLWGAPGSGRSHLLAATCALARSHGRDALLVRGGNAGADLPLPRGGLLAVDDVERLSPDAQVALFRAFNSRQIAGCALLLSGPMPPRDLALREDLRTRVGSALVFQVEALADADTADALTRHALARGLKVGPDLIDYLLRHGRRDLGSLMAVLDALDEATLLHQRPATLPLLRELLQTRLP